VTGATRGEIDPLSAVTKSVQTVGPLLVNHQGQQPSSPSRSTWHRDIRSATRFRPSEHRARLNLPATISTGFRHRPVFQDSLKGQGILILAAIFAAYVVLGILYESFIHPITIISGLPSAGVGRCSC
jgi:HAE1 family hydrophobic/amphiphilic exporter-1